MKVALLGATGSIGKSTLDVIRSDPDSFEVVLLTAHRNRELLEKIAKEFPHARIAVSNIPEAIIESGADIVINGIAGSAGLEPSRVTLENGIDLALANKESIVMAGPLLRECAARTGAKIIPVDSEHSAIFRLLERSGEIDEILLTASGGPFRTLSKETLACVGPEEALHHPTWNMGAKISLDSATMANKGLEVIEAARLFDLPVEKIKVVIHPQSIVHSMIRLHDGSVYAQLSQPDMRLPIQFALYYPDSAPKLCIETLHFDDLTLHFESPDPERFPMLPLAYQAHKTGPLYPIAYNAANEIAAEAFLSGSIHFMDIARITEQVLMHGWTGELKWESVWKTDHDARNLAKSII
ncbi:1-deoxy-D-xylulose 5-phosphate reductoisomerase [Spirochaetia bacterium]|nr:1-deoxy-D-xylulose 5-phosphate reductoisomerase [Spirochaetia bacterium]